MQTDYLIIGQGIAGTMLSWQLIEAGASVMVLDAPNGKGASQVASGVMNPVTGRHLLRSWDIEKFMPIAVQAYRDLEQVLRKPLIRQCNILNFHPTPQMHLTFQERLAEIPEYLHQPDDETPLREWFQFDFGVGETGPCWLIDLHSLLQAWRQQLLANGQLRETVFNGDDCKVQPDAVVYQDIQASAIIYCDGAAGIHNPYFNQLPFAPNKGQALIVSIPGLPQLYNYKQGINLLPWKENQFWAGASFEWNFEHDQPTEAFREKTIAQLRRWLKLPFEVVDHLSALRPATLERRPFVGMHPLHPRVGIFNGMGTKGCSLSPYFAREFAQHLLHQSPITAAVDVQRFTRILSR